MSIGIARSTPPTSQVKATNFQHNGSVQASLEEQFIQAGKKLYNLRRENAYAQKQPFGKCSDALYIKFLASNLEKAWKEFEALKEQVQQAELQLSSDALRIKELVGKYIDLNSPPPPIMKG